MATVLAVSGCGLVDGGDQLAEAPIATTMVTTVETTDPPADTSEPAQPDSAQPDSAQSDTNQSDSGQSELGLGADLAEGTVLNEDYTGVAAWGPVQFSFRTVTQTTYQGQPAIAVEFFARNTLPKPFNYNISVLSLLEPGQAYPTQAVGLVDLDGIEGVGFELPGDKLFVGVAFFPVAEPYSSADGLAVRVGTADVIYSDVPIDGTPYVDPEYPILIDLADVGLGPGVMEFTGTDLGLADCGTGFRSQSEAAVIALDPLRLIPTQPGWRYVWVRSRVEPVGVADVLCPTTEEVAMAVALTVETEAGQAEPLVSEARQSADLTTPTAVSYIGLWRIPLSTTELTLTPGYGLGQAVVQAVELDRYLPELNDPTLTDPGA